MILINGAILFVLLATLLHCVL